MEIVVVKRGVYKTRKSTARKTLRPKSLVNKPRKALLKNKPKTAKQKRLAKELALKKEWLVPPQSWALRFVGLRGIYWYWLSRDVRQKEWEKWNGECITCLVPLATWQEGQCGHILASAFCGEFLRLNPINLTLQHAGCNNPRFSPHAGVANALNIDKRHGAGYMEMLYNLRKRECKAPTTSEYERLIEGLDSYKMAKNKAQIETGDIQPNEK